MGRRCLGCKTPTVPMSVSQTVREGLIRHGQWPSWHSDPKRHGDSGGRWGNSASYHRTEDPKEPPTKRANLQPPRPPKRGGESSSGSTFQGQPVNQADEPMDTGGKMHQDEPNAKKRKSRAEKAVYCEVDEEFRSQFSSDSDVKDPVQPPPISWDAPGQQQNIGPADVLIVERARAGGGRRGAFPSYVNRAFCPADQHQRTGPQGDVVLVVVGDRRRRRRGRRGPYGRARLGSVGP